jgi:hypothetical protein
MCSFPNGADFCGRVNLRPDQHIYRRANPAWIPDRPDRPRRGNRPPLPPQPQATISKFRVRRYVHNNRDYWSPYDLLGLFLSLMASAPAGATMPTNISLLPARTCPDPSPLLPGCSRSSVCRDAPCPTPSLAARVPDAASLLPARTCPDASSRAINTESSALDDARFPGAYSDQDKLKEAEE